MAQILRAHHLKREAWEHGLLAGGKSLGKKKNRENGG